MRDPASLPGPKRERWTWFWGTVAFAFLIFNANFRELGLADTVPATLLAASIVRDFDLTLDEFAPMLDEPAPDPRATLGDQITWTMAIRRVHGHLRSSYPVGAAILAAPVYAVPVALHRLHHFQDYRVVAKVAASLIAALSAGFVLLCLLRFADLRSALLLTATYAFGTSVWTIASQALWQHGPALLCLSLATWASLRLSEEDTPWNAVLVSVGCAMAVVCRPQNAVSSLAIGLCAAATAPRRWLPLLLPGAIIGGLLVWYDERIFGTLSGGYEALYAAPAHAFRHLTPKTALTLPLAEGLSGLLLSPSRGLFVYSPVLAIGFVSLSIAALTVPLARYLLAWVVITLCLYGKNHLWWGGTSYGPRYLTELSLPLVLGLGMGAPRLARRRVLSALAVGIAAIGLGVQALGAFTWECGWHILPYWVNYRPDRVWDFRDPEIPRCLDELWSNGPKAAEFGPFSPRRPRGRRVR